MRFHDYVEHPRTLKSLVFYFSGQEKGTGEAGTEAGEGFMITNPEVAQRYENKATRHGLHPIKSALQDHKRSLAGSAASPSGESWDMGPDFKEMLFKIYWYLEMQSK